MKFSEFCYELSGTGIEFAFDEFGKYFNISEFSPDGEVSFGENGFDVVFLHDLVNNVSDTSLGFEKEELYNFLNCLKQQGIQMCSDVWARHDKEKERISDNELRNISRSSDTVDIASRANSDKPDFSFMTPDTMLEIAKVAAFGRNKYPDINGNLNWKQGFSYMSLFNSLMRHLMAFMMGETNDKESGAPHLAHAMWNLNVLFHESLNEKYEKFDNRQHKK